MFRKITKKWLAKHNVEYDIFHMRKNDDNRKDSLVKKNMYNKYIKNKFQVEFILDDRDQVVQMWREDLVLKCFQVNYGNF